MTRLEDITYVDWQPMLNQIGEAAEGIDDINQCLANIIKTRKGSVPHRPTFGSDVYLYVDYPISEAIHWLMQMKVQQRRLHYDI